jgi:hypothetical protein
MTDHDRPTITNRKFAKDVAKELDRRGMRRKFLLVLALASAIVLALYYGTCGGGWGLGGKGKGSGAGQGPGSPTPLASLDDAAARRCTVLIAATGITVDGAPSTRDEAVTRCKATAGADVIVTGDTRQGDWDDLRSAFDAAGIVVFKREPKGAGGDAGTPTADDAPAAP